MKQLVLASVAAALLSGCAHISATPVASGKFSSIKGIPFFLPKAFVVVDGDGTKPLIVPDCSKEYRLQVSSFLAKHHAKVDFTNGMITSVDSEQDSTAIPLALIQLVKEAALAGKPIAGAFGDKSAGGLEDRFGIIEFSCVDGKLSSSLFDPTSLASIKSSRPAPTFVGALPDSGKPGNATPGQDLPK